MNIILKRTGKRPVLHICVPGKDFAYCGRYVKHGKETKDGEICEKCENIMKILVRKRISHVRREESVQGKARARV